eukprot:TRINITY_DN11358_c0_g1_i4.p1 TRINITY_DN11358_c0_g1~~TRINITY_DN11358_c0_g1_i4.p1  ORF type:complete len:165 (-),score=12.59 TRINITY_DN11358_c0_g1_i4:32-526(-)
MDPDDIAYEVRKAGELCCRTLTQPTSNQLLASKRSIFDVISYQQVLQQRQNKDYLFAVSLLSYAVRTAKLHQVESDLQRMTEEVKSNKLFAKYIASQNIPIYIRRRLQKILVGQSDQTSVPPQFFRILMDQHSLSSIPFIAKHYQDLLSQCGQKLHQVFSSNQS